ncbi:hypothetical protein ACNOYE_18715 [Nannocystaceae bacterium ST9]
MRSYAGSQPPSHFALVPEHDITPLRRSQLEGAGIRLLPYSADNQHAELLDILRRLETG